MTNLRDAWQQDMAAAANQNAFTATVTAVNGDGTVTFKRYPDATAETQPKLASYTSPQVGDVVAVEALGSGWLVVGLVTPIYQPIAVVTSLPTASATYRGVALRVQGGTGVADAVYICEKGTSGAYSWVQMDDVANVYGILGTASSSSQSGITTDTALTGLSIAVTPPTGHLRFTITLPLQDQLTGGGNGAGCRVSLKQGGTVIKTFDRAFPPGMAINQYDSCSWSWVISASSGTYSLSLQSLDSGSGSAKVNSGGQFVIEAVP